MYIPGVGGGGPLRLPEVDDTSLLRSSIEGVGGGGISVAAVSGVGGTGGTEGVAGVALLVPGRLCRLGEAREGAASDDWATKDEISSAVLMFKIASSELAAVTRLLSNVSTSCVWS